jgi:RHS repeat-associated protein
MDQLNRLVQSASNVSGTMPFAYDGFGNLTQQGQTVLSIDPNTNRINSAGYQYNANGNVIQTPDQTTYTYDVENRLVSNYAIYNPHNQRVFDGGYIYLYTPDGKLVGQYAPYWSGSGRGSQALLQGQPNVYFGGKLIQEQGLWVMTDRLGSVRLHATNGRSSYYPYGAEVAPATPDHLTKFATYYRDIDGLDYAGQRYYASAMGRFLTPDRGGIRAASPSRPSSWNRYAYVEGDPVNSTDRHGLFTCVGCGDDDEEPDDPCDDDPTMIGCGGGGGAVYGHNPLPAAGGSGGGGTPPNWGGWATNPAATGSTAWQYLTSIWSKCLNDFKQLPGFNATSFGELLTGGMAWLDTRNGAYANMAINAYTNDGNTATLGSLFTSWQGNVAVTLTGTHYVALGLDYFTDETQTEQIAVAIHEALHMATGLGDFDLKQALSAFGYTPTKDSQSITDWIVGSADHMSTNSGGCTNPGGH